ncbi:MAG: hypothetical protein KJ749_07515 [Planctomycetes bacterium]|nr:hypothetical protein [Planctomycetota bacterium]
MEAVARCFSRLVPVRWSTWGVRRVTGGDPKELKYTPDRRLRTEAAADQAIEIVDRLCEPNSSCREEDEEVLFAALQTCAYRAARPARGKRIAARERQQWARR